MALKVIEYRKSTKQSLLNMKKLNLLAGSLAAGWLLLWPTATQAGILNSPHDFSQRSWNLNNPSDPNAVCTPCHQAHHADSRVIPLWGHTTSTGPWIMYNTNNVPVSHMVAVPSPTPTGPSLACLSCHDGTVAVNSYGGGIQGIGGAYNITNSANLGTDLTHSHPISFTYDATLVGTGPNQDQWLYNPDTTQVLTPDNGTFVPGNDMTINGFLLGGHHRLECDSCHAVHNQVGTPYNAINNPDLVVINGTRGGVGSLLCRSCHNK
jgi:hypothetical protein